MKRALVVLLLAVALGACGEGVTHEERVVAQSKSRAMSTLQEFTLKDGTRCVAIGDKALVCDFSKPVY